MAHRGETMNRFDDCFAELTDPRQTAVDMAIFAGAKREFLGRFLQLRNGVPSHDTFSRLFRQLDPDQFRACFQKFVARFGESCGGVIAINGKTACRSSDPNRARSVVHMISAWCCEKRLVLAQIATHASLARARPVMKLLDLLSLKGTIVTTDALNCQRNIARQIVGRGGEYVLALKGNHRALHADVSQLLDQHKNVAADKHTTVDGDHGRIETRTSCVSTEIAALQNRHQWPGLTAVGKVVRTRDSAATKATAETAYCLLSKALSPERLEVVVRSPWGSKTACTGFSTP
jgi:predicted transposase YbfD/YdcC